MTTFTDLLFWVIGTAIFWSTLLSIFKMTSSPKRSSVEEKRFQNRVTCTLCPEDNLSTSFGNDVRDVVPFHNNDYYSINPGKLETLTYISISRRID